MFVRKKCYASGSLSVQVIQEGRGKNKVVITIGCATTRHKVEELVNLAKEEIKKLSQQQDLLESEVDATADKVFAALENAGIRTIGPEILFSALFCNTLVNPCKSVLIF